MRTAVLLCLLLAISVKTAVTWNYATMGANWPSDSNYPDCALNAQSPIDIPRTSLTNDHTTTTDIQGSYGARSGLSLLNSSGMTQKVSALTNSNLGTTTWNSKTYTMLQFHTHQPSEHTFDGMRYDMELHFVHQQGTAADYLVLTALFNIGPTANSFLTDIGYASGNATTDASNTIASSINVWDVLGKIQGDKQYIYYSGSFTTPPCTEGVTFIIFRDALQMSKAQWDGYVTSLPSVTFSYTTATGNYRVVNALNGRTITQRYGVLKNAKLIIASIMTVFVLLMNM
jgi:carbonic anhydrase